MFSGFKHSILLFSYLLSFAPADLKASETGRDAAMKYFRGKKSSRSRTRGPQSAEVPGRQLLGVAVGNLLSSKNYHWMENDDVGGWNLELAYTRSDQGWFARRYSLELQQFSANEARLSKLSFLFTFLFPRRLEFPVYIGFAAGPGYFIKQRRNESEFSIDYKAFLGLRLNDPNSQYFLQSGVKNHVHVLSDGQFIGWYISSGVAYKF